MASKRTRIFWSDIGTPASDSGISARGVPAITCYLTKQFIKRDGCIGQTAHTQHHAQTHRNNPCISSGGLLIVDSVCAQFSQAFPTVDGQRGLHPASPKCLHKDDDKSQGEYQWRCAICAVPGPLSIALLVCYFNSFVSNGHSCDHPSRMIASDPRAPKIARRGTQWRIQTSAFRSCSCRGSRHCAKPVDLPGR